MFKFILNIFEYLHIVLFLYVRINRSFFREYNLTGINWF